jgi:hypothetical protein
MVKWNWRGRERILDTIEDYYNDWDWDDHDYEEESDFDDLQYYNNNTDYYSFDNYNNYNYYNYNYFNY